MPVLAHRPSASTAKAPGALHPGEEPLGAASAQTPTALHLPAHRSSLESSLPGACGTTCRSAESEFLRMGKYLRHSVNEA